VRAYLSAIGTVLPKLDQGQHLTGAEVAEWKEKLRELRDPILAHIPKLPKA
jgi:hypothetical protein